MFSCRCLIRPQPVHCKIPLKSVSFNAIVQNSLFHLSIFQTFTNEEQKPIECEYMFSVLDDSAITNLKIHLADGTILTSRVEPADKAAEIYQDSIAEGNTVALGKIEVDDKMTILIGNLAPNDSVRVEFNLVFPLSADESFWKLSIPAGFLPASDLNSLLSFDFSVQIISQSPITLYSSNCSLDFQLSPDTLMLQGTLPAETYKKFSNKHLWVKFRSSDTNTPSCIIQQIGSRFIGMLSFIPFNTNIESLDEVEGQGEYIFVLDRSGSMKGNRIEMAKQAAILFLNSLPTGSLFNIVSFGGRFDFLFQTSQPNTSNKVKAAIARISAFSADMGGTNIYQPLSLVFSKSPARGYPRTIFLLTDGQVSDPGEVVEIIRKNSGKCRVHGFGIGEDVDVSLIKNSAKAGKGCASFITNTEDIGKKVISALQKCIFPCVNEWCIDWNGECYPNTDKIGSLYYGERCIQYVMLDERPNRAINIRFFDNYSKEFKEHSICNFQEVPGDSLLKLWTKGKLDYLLNDSAQNEIQIVQLSVESGIPTTLTSFVCVKENDEPVTDEMVNRKVAKNKLPISFRPYWKYFPKEEKANRQVSGRVFLCRSIGMISSNLPDTSVKKSMAPAYSASSTRSFAAVKKEGQISKPSSLGCQMKAKAAEKSEKRRSKMEDCDEEESKIESRGHSGSNLYLSFISKIETEGFWIYQEFIGELPEIKRIPEGLVECPDKKNVICTLFVLAYLHKNFEDKFDEWVLVERKALKWLRSIGVSFKDLHETIKGYLT